MSISLLRLKVDGDLLPGFALGFELFVCNPPRVLQCTRTVFGATAETSSPSVGDGRHVNLRVTLHDGFPPMNDTHAHRLLVHGDTHRASQPG